MLRKVDNSAGAGLKGEGIGDANEVLNVGGLAGGLPELFFVLAIVITPYRRDPPVGVTSLTIR